MLLVYLPLMSTVDTVHGSTTDNDDDSVTNGIHCNQVLTKIYYVEVIKVTQIVLLYYILILVYSITTCHTCIYLTVIVSSDNVHNR